MIALAVFSASVAVYSSRQLTGLLDSMVAENLSSTKAAEEEQILQEIALDCQAYDAQRNLVIFLYDQGHADQARALVLGDLQVRYQQVYDACERFLAANERYIGDNTVERDSFGPIGASCTKVRCRHLAIVSRFTPYCRERAAGLA